MASSIVLLRLYRECVRSADDLLRAERAGAPNRHMLARAERRAADAYDTALAKASEGALAHFSKLLGA